MADILKNNESGQTLVEYLLLIAASAITAYLIVSRGPLPEFTMKMLQSLKGAITSILRTGEIENTGDFSDKRHPSSKERLKAVHE